MISTILDHIDIVRMALPEFQRGYLCIHERGPARRVAPRFRAILQQAMEAA